VRGQLRQWKEKLAQQYREFDNAYRDARTQPLVMDFLKRSSREGRRRAFRKLARAFGPSVTLEGLRLDGDYPMAVWSILMPRESVTAGAPAESGLAQDCITVNCLLAGRLPSWVGPGIPGAKILGHAEGLWALEVSDHALGRVIERSGHLPDAFIVEAHRNVLRQRQDQLPPLEVIARQLASSDGFRMTLGSQFLVRAGGGGFICVLTLGAVVSNDEDPRVPLSALPGRKLGVSARAATWITDDMVRERQVFLADDGMPGERLGDGWLMPELLRQIWFTENMSINLSCEPGFPELLVKPAGRA
jgi:hypothetical protein